MGVVSEAYVPQEFGTTGIDSATINTVEDTALEALKLHGHVLATVDADADDVKILNWIGKFTKPLEARIVDLERQVDFLRSLVVNPVAVVEVKSAE